MIGMLERITGDQHERGIGELRLDSFPNLIIVASIRMVAIDERQPDRLRVQDLAGALILDPAGTGRVADGRKSAE